MNKGQATPIDTATTLYGVFGHPVAHSKSPLMLNRAFREAGINAAYAAFHVLPGMLEDAVRGIRALGFRGVNVTVPHKVEVMRYLDAVDPEAERIGAVNTIVNEQGRLTGYNTDGIGYVRSLKEETGFSPAGRRIVLVGAGGAARGIAFALAKEGPARLVLANRTAAKAESLAEDLSGLCASAGVSLDQAADELAQADLIVNTTLVGMHPHPDELPVDPSLLRAGQLVSDIVYTPRETALLKEARARGAAVHGGLGMFIYQGAYAFEYWTGTAAPVEAMRQAVEEALGAHA
ncbi:shikimate dehydrogenase (NADP(+)) [Paenibacillus sp. J31TS4]|uniref:shikimate dehydrogenase n=1 Tax=Paenibacillus sp. J31TS4 TaxID=2807195 RepID=UPI001B14B96A|nr:shikimate dehydrogenase [Paenibacillus sp. J31TS4]GIP39550.1 shikimate dehydrogenase (NADP(+)) [Paenibacillus sp. J31TS4]